MHVHERNAYRDILDKKGSPTRRHLGRTAIPTASRVSSA